MCECTHVEQKSSECPDTAHSPTSVHDLVVSGMRSELASWGKGDVIFPLVMSSFHW